MTKPVGHLINNVSGIEGEPGIFYSYILAADGVYLRAKNEHLAVTINIANQEIRGLSPLKEDIQLLHDKIPLHFLNLALSVLSIKPDIEQYIAVTWQGSYSLRIPNQQATPGSVTYETLPDTVLDIHSHTGSMPAQFSGIDDHDEKGFCLYAVVADLRQLCPTVELRLGTYGYFLPLEKEEVFA